MLALEHHWDMLGHVQTLSLKLNLAHLEGPKADFLKPLKKLTELALEIRIPKDDVVADWDQLYAATSTMLAAFNKVESVHLLFSGEYQLTNQIL